MANIAKVQYLGALRAEVIHLKSNKSFITDAPVDNNGKGESFSPTDLVAVSLGDCMLTVMGIKAQSLGFDLEEATAEIEKVMGSGPRRIVEIGVKITLRQNCDDRTRGILEETGRRCPVALSLNENIRQVLSFHWI